ncbi:unnamed protein product [Spirodela intermedia]|uniref:Uncharacterized protein n=1 Tax=Spirodela intermedia TaxID=51605 RepID=A0A7I8IAC8_SPIIN|nr:unnamed protein product [Spirodela intermedia]CAA6654687.1 unnamed protein product [Spirodela intermedia]
MGNSLRCCLACVLPFGVLDVARIVHLNGQVEEFCRPVTAGEILRANPDHVLSRPSSEGEGRRILVVSPESILERGTIYFLIRGIPSGEEEYEEEEENPEDLHEGQRALGRRRGEPVGAEAGPPASEQPNSGMASTLREHPREDPSAAGLQSSPERREREPWGKGNFM